MCLWFVRNWRSPAPRMTTVRLHPQIPHQVPERPAVKNDRCHSAVIQHMVITLRAAEYDNGCKIYK